MTRDTTPQIYLGSVPKLAFPLNGKFGIIDFFGEHGCLDTK